MVKKEICFGCQKEGSFTSQVTIETNNGTITEKCHTKCKDLTKLKLLKRREINYNEKLADIESDYNLLKNVFVHNEHYDEEEKTYTSWELLNKEKVILKFKERFQKLLSELNDRPYDPNASLLIDKLTTYILNLGQEREMIRFCSPHDILSDSKEVSFVCNGAEWYESPMIDVFAYMRKYGYPPHGNCPAYITFLCKSIKEVPIENKEEWEKLRLYKEEAEYDGGMVRKQYQNAMIGIFDQIRILLIQPSYERKARVIYKLHRQYQFSPTYLSRTLLSIFNIHIPINEIMDISSFQELKINGDPEWLKSLAII